jgi:hypothetical protein
MHRDEKMQMWRILDCSHVSHLYLWLSAFGKDNFLSVWITKDNFRPKHGTKPESTCKHPCVDPVHADSNDKDPMSRFKLGSSRDQSDCASSDVSIMWPRCYFPSA